MKLERKFDLFALLKYKFRGEIAWNTARNVLVFHKAIGSRRIKEFDTI